MNLENDSEFIALVESKIKHKCLRLTMEAIDCLLRMNDEFRPLVTDRANLSMLITIYEVLKYSVFAEDRTEEEISHLWHGFFKSSEEVGLSKMDADMQLAFEVIRLCRYAILNDFSGATMSDWMLNVRDLFSKMKAHIDYGSPADFDDDWEKGLDAEGRRRAELGFECLAEYVKLHLRTDDTPMDVCYEKSDGKLMKLPMDQWNEIDSKPFEEIIDLLMKDEDGTLNALKAGVGRFYMPETLKKRLMGPSKPDLKMPKIDFERVKVGDTPGYEMARGITEEQRNDPEFMKRAFKGSMAFCIQRILYHYLTSPGDMVATFNHPNLRLDLKGSRLRIRGNSVMNGDRKLVIGIVREVLILPRFGSMYNFWMKHAEMIREGGNLQGFYVGPRISADEIAERYFKDDPDARKMLDLCVDLGMFKDRFNYSMNHLCSRWENK